MRERATPPPTPPSVAGRLLQPRYVATVLVKNLALVSLQEVLRLLLWMEAEAVLEDRRGAGERPQRQPGDEPTFWAQNQGPRRLAEGTLALSSKEWCKLGAKLSAERVARGALERGFVRKLTKDVQASALRKAARAGPLRAALLIPHTQFRSAFGFCAASALVDCVWLVLRLPGAMGTRATAMALATLPLTLLSSCAGAALGTALMPGLGTTIGSLAAEWVAVIALQGLLE